MKLKQATWALAAAVLVSGSGFAAAAEGDFYNIEKAIEKAKAEKKDVLVDFTGSDWCGWCIKLHNEVFSKTEWKNYSDKNLVFVELDFPRDKSKVSAKQQAYNQAQSDAYGVQGYPTILLIDEDGLVFGKTGYQRGGPKGYIAHIKNLKQQKEAIQAACKSIESGSEKEKLASLVELQAKLKAWKIESFHMWVLGILLVQLAFHYHGKGNAAEYGKYLAMVREADKDEAPFVETSIKIEEEVNPLMGQKKFKEAKAALEEVLKSEPKGKALQAALASLAFCEFRLGNRDRTLEHLRAAVDAAPDTDQAKELEGAIKQVKEEK